MTAIRIALRCVGILVDQVGAHAERLLGVLVPELAGVDGGVADALVDELVVPGLATQKQSMVPTFMFATICGGGTVMVATSLSGSMPPAASQ